VRTDDLRFYALVQFYPMVAILLMLWLFPARYTRGSDFLGAVAWYVLAKFLEHFDGQVFALSGASVSGHSLKHLAAAMTVFWILRMLKRRGALA
jgi:hypothetical protein